MKCRLVQNGLNEYYIQVEFREHWISTCDNPLYYWDTISPIFKTQKAALKWGQKYKQEETSEQFQFEQKQNITVISHF